MFLASIQSLIAVGNVKQCGFTFVLQTHCDRMLTEFEAADFGDMVGHSLLLRIVVYKYIESLLFNFSCFMEKNKLLYRIIFQAGSTLNTYTDVSSWQKLTEILIHYTHEIELRLCILVALLISFCKSFVTLRCQHFGCTFIFI